LSPQEVHDIAALMEKYQDLPMDVADATLVWLAGRTGIMHVITPDSTDFSIYRLPGGKRLVNILETS
jgi:uncharacterized protein